MNALLPPRDGSEESALRSAGRIAAVFTLTVLAFASFTTWYLQASAQTGGNTDEEEDPLRGTYPILAPCSQYDEVYRELNFLEKDFDEWPDEYHERVEEILEEHIALDASTAQCSAGTYAGLTQPEPQVRRLARQLPPWFEDDDDDGRDEDEGDDDDDDEAQQEDDDEDKQPRLSEVALDQIKSTDIGVVLLEYLRAYECALNEHYFSIRTEIVREQDPRPPTFSTSRSRESRSSTSSSSTSESSSSTSRIVDLSDLNAEQDRRLRIIQEELAISRPALFRALSFISPFDRLRTLEIELQCLQRASLDIRNLAALAAETSSCLPRVFNAKDVFHEVEAEEDE